MVQHVTSLSVLNELVMMSAYKTHKMTTTWLSVLLLYSIYVTEAFSFLFTMRTIGKTTNGSSCPFPFSYTGVDYKECIPDPEKDNNLA